MLAELEVEIIESLRSAPFAPKLRAIDALPDLTPDVIRRLATTTPSVYVACGDVVHGDVVQATFDLLCLARNAAGPKQARHGDTTHMGLYPLMDAVSFWFDSRDTGSAVWSATRGKFLRQSAWPGMGLSPAVVSIGAKVLPDKLQYLIDTDALAQFTTFHADYDIKPFDSADEHAKWLQEPADYSASKPELTDTTTLQETP